MNPHLPPDEAIVAGLLLIGVLIAIWWTLEWLR
jgi:hypothetical protein